MSPTSSLVVVKRLWRIIYWNIEYKILYIRSFHFWFRRTVSEAPGRRLIWWLIFTSIGWWRVTWWWPSLAWTRLSNRISSSFWSCPFSISGFSCFTIFLCFSCWSVLWNLTFELNVKLINPIFEHILSSLAIYILPDEPERVEISDSLEVVCYVSYQPSVILYHCHLMALYMVSVIVN